LLFSFARMRLRYAILLALVVALAVLYFSPFFVGGGLRLWASWQARQQGLRIELGKIDAPFLRPAVIRNLRIIDPRGSSIQIDAEQITLYLNLGRILIGTRGRSIRAVSMQRLRAQINHNLRPEAQNSHLNWAVLQTLLPGSFNIANFELRVEGEDSVILLRNSSVSGSEVEAGRFSAEELTIASPLLHQTFSHLRGATKWQDNRLTLGGITLGRGLDLQTLIVDLAHLGKERADFQFDLDTFGGKIRASFANEWRSAHSNWEFAGSANDISLAQTSEALGFTDQLGGSLRACKFTFRGDPNDVTHATASIWTELTGLSWRQHTADTIMLGAVFYNRQIQLQQLYVKQRDNQLTLNGEGSLRSKPSEWLSPDFRGTVSGSINDLGEFASLFGARAGDFAGKITLAGTMDTRERRIGGHLIASGSGLSIFKTQIDQFTASLSVKASQLEIEQLDLSRKNDWLHAQGKIDIGDAHNYSGSVSADIANLTDYLSIFGLTNTIDPHPAAAHLQCMIDAGVWNGNATITTSSSRPVSIGAISLPLWPGETWDEFSVRPLNVILTFPLLSFDNSPRWLGLGIFRGGILSGGIHISGTLRNPNIDGDAQLINGRTKSEAFGINGMSGYARFNGSHGLIDFLRVTNNNVDLSFNGEVEISDTDRIRVNLTSDLPLFDLTATTLDCPNRITVSPTETMFAPIVSQFEFQGGLFNRNWTMMMRPTPAKSPEPESIDTRTVPLCLGGGPAEKVLSLGVYSPPQPTPAPPRKRPRRRQASI
jgi:hypothetical protein